jgi:ADP-dependent phosphofructokinase/glucokinase
LKRQDAEKRRVGGYMEERIWQELYRNLEIPLLGRTIVGFNVNIDRSVPVTHDLLGSLPSPGGELAVFRDRLFRSMQTCTADELFVQDRILFRQFEHQFHGSSAIGGQAGIAAVQLASAGAEVICIAPSMGVMTREKLREAGVTIPGPVRVPAEPDTVHLVFEHSPGLVPVNEGTIPRSNRFIVSPHHDASAIIPGGDTQEEFRTAASSCTRAFLSGYQYLTSGEEFREAADQLAVIKSGNPHLRIHVEWVTVEDSTITGLFIRHILPRVHSLGVNERELGLLYRSLQPLADGDSGHPDQDAITLASYARELCCRAGLVRLHLHTYGYYIVVCKNPSYPEMARNALLFASRTVARASGGGEPRIIPEGRRALEDISSAFGREIAPGIFRAGEYRIIVVPSLVAREISTTVGLGDRISSLAFVADPF